jgi:hypothetical protein
MKQLLIEMIADLSVRGLSLSPQGTVQIATRSAWPAELSQEITRRRRAFERWRTDGEFQREQAELLLNRRGVIMRVLHGISTLLIPSDRDGPAVRLAIRILCLDDVPLRYLDADGVPARLQESRCSAWERSQSW